MRAPRVSVVAWALVFKMGLLDWFITKGCQAVKRSRIEENKLNNKLIDTMRNIHKFKISCTCIQSSSSEIPQLPNSRCLKSPQTCVYACVSDDKIRLIELDD